MRLDLDIPADRPDDARLDFQIMQAPNSYPTLLYK